MDYDYKDWTEKYNYCVKLISRICELDSKYDNKPCANLRPTKTLGIREPVKAWPSET